jgi:hypothetical protein
MVVRYADSLTTGGFRYAGTANTTGNRRFYIGRQDTAMLYGIGALYSQTNGPTAGVAAIAGTKVYSNSVELATNAAMDTPENLYAITIGASNANGTPGTFLTGSIQAVAIYNAILTPAQVAAVSAAMALL